MKRTAQLLAATAFAALGLYGGVASAADLTISFWGGSSGENFKNFFVKPFEEENGVEIAVDAGRSSERLSKLLATKGRGVDLVFLTDFQMYEAKKRGIVAELNVENVPNINNLRDFAKDPMGGNTCPGYVILGAGLAYNTDHFGDKPPTSWKDLLSDDLQGKAGYPDIGISYATLLAIKMAEIHGGSIDGIEPGLKAIKESSENLQFYASREILESLVRGDVSLTPQLNIFVKKEEGIPMGFAWPEDGGLGVLNLICTVEGSQNAELAEKFINYMLSDEVQNDLLHKQGETPASVNVDLSNVHEMSRHVLSNDAIDSLNFWDVETIANSKAVWVTLWEEMVVAN